MQIMIGLVVGLIFGYWISTHDQATRAWYASIIQPFSQIFIRMIRMIIAPLLFGTLVAGIAGAGHFKDVGRMGLRAIIYFEVVTTLALLIGLVTVNVMQPGDRHDAAAPQGAPPISATAQTWQQILLHMVPTSVIEAMATGDVLQIVVFSIVFAIGLGMVGEKGKPMIAVVRVADRGDVQGHQHRDAVCADRRRRGDRRHHRHERPGGAGQPRANWSGTLYLALAVFFCLVLIPVMLMFRIPIVAFFKAIKEPALIAFSTTSSEAALPRAMESVEAFGVPRRIVSFILPLGYSFNLDGSTLYLSLAAVFVAQAAGVELTIGQQMTMLLTLMLTSKGVAGVPRASLVILAATLASYNLPLEGITLILGVDALMDMGRTMTNVIGNCLASVVVAKWEGEFRPASGQAA